MYRLLVADDEKKLLKGLCEFYPWRDWGYQIVARSENGREALSYISTHPVDVVFTDISMPVMDGLELARILHNDYPEIKIIFLSGFSEFEYARTALKYGVQDYILKPVKANELFKVFSALKQQLDGTEALKATETDGYYKNIVKATEKYVCEHLKTANLDEAAMLVNLSSGYLSTLYKKETGNNFSDFVLKSRMEMACKLLADPERRMYSISEALGYENPKNFARAFKAYFGKSPRDYRLNGSEPAAPADNETL